MKRIREPLRTSTWNVTFADLMMLLLSFFVLKISLTPPAALSHHAQTSRHTANGTPTETTDLQPIEATVFDDPASPSSEPLSDASPGFKVLLTNCFDEINSLRFDCRTTLLTLAGIAKRKRLAIHAEVEAATWSLAADQTTVILSQLIDSGVSADGVTGMGSSHHHPLQSTPRHTNSPSLSTLTIALHTNR